MKVDKNQALSHTFFPLINLVSVQLLLLAALVLGSVGKIWTINLGVSRDPCQWSPAKNWVIGTHDANDNDDYDDHDDATDNDDDDDART